MDLDARDEEYLSVLHSNIEHPLVKEIHLLYTDTTALEVGLTACYSDSR